MPTFDELDMKFIASHGEDIGGRGAVIPTPERSPTGIFNLDAAIGGGWPRGHATMIFGPESAGKTLLALKSVAEHQRQWPDLKCAWFDIENAFDPSWAERLGVSVDDLYVYLPSYGEQAIDMIYAFAEASDCGMIVVDSLAALSASKIIEESAERQFMGTNPQMIGRLAAKITKALKLDRSRGRLPTVLYVNQVRMKIGVVRGSPVTIPGGQALRHHVSLILRLWGRQEVDEKVSRLLPTWLHQTGSVVKKRVLVSLTTPEWDICLYPHGDLKVGYANDWPAIVRYMKLLGQLRQCKKKSDGWDTPLGAFKRQGDLRRLVNEDPAKRRELQDIITEEMEKRTILAGGALDFEE